MAQAGQPAQTVPPCPPAAASHICPCPRHDLSALARARTGGEQGGRDKVGRRESQGRWAALGITQARGAGELATTPTPTLPPPASSAAASSSPGHKHWPTPAPPHLHRHLVLPCPDGHVCQDVQHLGVRAAVGGVEAADSSHGGGNAELAGVARHYGAVGLHWGGQACG